MGRRFPTQAEAVDASLDEWAAVESDLTINPPKVTERWKMRTPDDCLADVPVATVTIAPHLTVGVVGTEARRKVREDIRNTPAGTDSDA